MGEFVFLRHGRTPGNEAGRYVGRTDEGLSPGGRAALAGLTPPPASALYVSPMLRCMESARLLYPSLSPVAVAGFQECDFGAFEYKTYRELSGDPRYQAWIDSGGRLPFPGGEAPESFRARCRAAFLPLLKEEREERTALVVHGGTIMAILSGFVRPSVDYFDFQVENGGGFLCRSRGGFLQVLGRLEPPYTSFPLK